MLGLVVQGLQPVSAGMCSLVLFFTLLNIRTFYFQVQRTLQEVQDLQELLSVHRVVHPGTPSPPRYTQVHPGWVLWHTVRDELGPATDHAMGLVRVGVGTLI